MEVTHLTAFFAYFYPDFKKVDISLSLAQNEKTLNSILFSPCKLDNQALASNKNIKGISYLENMNV